MRAALRQMEHRLLEEGLRIQQLVEEFKFKQKTIGRTFKIIVAVLCLSFNRTPQGQRRLYAGVEAAQRSKRHAARAACR